MTSEVQSEEVYDEGPLIPEHTKQASIATLWLLFSSTLMFTLPFGAFFGIKHLLQQHYDVTDEFTINAWSVFAAVLTVNAIIIMYAVKAYVEDEYDEEGNELNKDGTVREKKDN